MICPHCRLCVLDCADPDRRRHGGYGLERRLSGCYSKPGEKAKERRDDVPTTPRERSQFIFTK